MSQPGGGGGLAIMKFYDAEGKSVQKEDLPLVRSFVMYNLKELMHENYPDDANSYTARRYGFSSDRCFLFLSPFRDDISSKKNEDVIYRVLISFKQQWMMIDFINVLGENGAGHTDEMDSLVFQAGYFTCDLQKKRTSRATNATDPQIRKWLKSGITPYTINALSNTGNVSFSSSVNLDFLSEISLPASYFIHLGKYQFQQKNDAEVFRALRIAAQKNRNTYNCEMLFLLADTYNQLNDYNNAADIITKALDCKRSRWDEEPKVENLRYRASLFTKAGRFEDALNDYNKILNITTDKLTAQKDRLNFLVYEKKDYTLAIKDLRKLIDSKPDDKYEDAMGFRSEYNSIYFLMAEALYQNNQQKESWPYYLKAEQTGYNYSSSYQPIDRFDVLIAKHPGIPELYLSRALALYQRAPYMGWGDSTRHHFQRALDDLQAAETFGYKSYLLYMYRANILDQNKQYQEALNTINKAIRKKRDHLFSYIVRYQIRSNMGLARWGDKTDSDQLIIERLKKGLKPVESNGHQADDDDASKE